MVVSLVHHHKGDETLSIKAGEGERCATEWCSITILSPPYPVTCEELICAYHIVQLPLGSNTMSSQFHTCDGRGFSSSSSDGTNFSSTGRLNSVG